MLGPVNYNSFELHYRHDLFDRDDNVTKDIFIKKITDQARSKIKEILPLKYFISICYHDFRSLLWVRNKALLIKLRRLRN